MTSHAVKKKGKQRKKRKIERKKCKKGKDPIILIVDEDVEQLDYSYNAGDNVK